MTVAEATSLVFTNISGGRPSSEVDAHPASIRKYLAAAAAEIFSLETQRRSRDQGSWRNSYRELVDPVFYQDRVFPVERIDSDYPVIKLDPPPIEVGDLIWMDGAYPELDGPIPSGADSGFRMIKSLSNLRSTDRDMLGHATFMVYSGGELRLVNLAHVVQRVRVRYAPSIDGLAPGDELPIPENLYASVIDRAAQFFSAGRNTPAERAEDDRDEPKMQSR